MSSLCRSPSPARPHRRSGLPSFINRTYNIATQTAVKPVFATLEQALVIRQLGTLGRGDQATLRKAIAETLG